MFVIVFVIMIIFEFEFQFNNEFPKFNEILIIRICSQNKHQFISLLF